MQETGSEDGTRIIFSGAEVFEEAYKYIDQMQDEGLIFVPGENRVKTNREFFERVAARALETGARVRMLARFSKDEVKFLEELQSQGLEVRRPASRDRFKLAIGVYDRKWMGLVDFEPSATRRQFSGITSTDRKMIDWLVSVFEMVWDNAIPFEDATAEVERGVEPPRLKIFRDRTRVPEVFLQQVARARKELLLLLPTADAFHRLEAIGLVRALKHALDRKVRVRVLAPLNPSIEETLLGMHGGKLLSFRRVTEAAIPNTVTVLVADRLASLVLEEKDPTSPRFEDAIGESTYSTRNSTVLANVRFFERMWEEVELNKRLESALSSEKTSRRSSELFQDILAHDIKNYNQVSKLSAELLRKVQAANLKVLRDATAFAEAAVSGPKNPRNEAKALAKELHVSAKTFEESDLLIDAIVKATEGASTLADRAKKLGKIVSKNELLLVPVELNESISRSIALVSASHPEKKIVARYATRLAGRVLADEMLDEAFTNIISNSVRHTEGTEVPLDFRVERTTLEDPSTPFLKVSVSDHGNGIPDGMKAKLFTRYLKAASGTGLGLSIVHALATERYSGRVDVCDRVRGDYTKGTTIELWLQEAN